MSDVDRFIAGLRATQAPVCDDCLTTVVGWGQRQRANAVGRRLLAEGRISRNQGMCQKCGKWKIVSSSTGAQPAVLMVPASQRGSPSPAQVRQNAGGAHDPTALRIHDPRARDYYYVVPRAGGWQVVDVPKGQQLPPSEYNSINYSYAEKMTYGEVKALENKILAAQRREERAKQQAAMAKKRKKPHTLFWLLFAFWSREASNGISEFLRGK